MKRKIIQGTFIQPAFIINWTKESYNEHFKRYRKLGFDHVILQWSEYCEAETGNSFTYYPSITPNRTTKIDLITNLLEAGGEYDIRVFLGLGASKEWWSNIRKSPFAFEKWFSKQANDNISLLKDIWDTYAKRDCNKAIAGWYIVFEPDNINFNTSEKRKVLIKNCERIIDTAHKYTNLPIVMSPFFNRSFEQSQGPQKWGELIYDIAKGTGIDIIAIQDGIGCRRELIDDQDQARAKALKDVDKWFKASMKGIKKAGNNSKLWADIETFTERIEKGKSAFYAASIDRIIKQIEIEEPFVDKITSFSFQAYQDFDKSIELFECYENYVNDCIIQKKRLFWLDRNRYLK